MKSIICIAEDRVSCEPAVKLLLLSLRDQQSKLAIRLFYANAPIAFVEWSKRCPNVRVEETTLKKGMGWNIKPDALLHLLDEGFEEVIWIDSDILVVNNPDVIFAKLDEDVLVAAEDALGEDRDDGDAKRAQLWGLEAGRQVPFGLNSGVLRVTRAHHPLLLRWRELLKDSRYQECQTKPWKQRPPHMLGDQDVLTALLTSKEFSSIPLHFLRRGRDILQFNGVFGYTIPERLKNLAGSGPTFIHSFGDKPWAKDWSTETAAGPLEYFKKMYLDLSPYTISALCYRSQMECETDWMKPHFALSRMLRAVGLGSSAAAGLPLAIVGDSALAVKFFGELGRGRSVRSKPA